MTNSEATVLNISRLLTPEHQGDLLAFVHLAHVVETSAKQKMATDIPAVGEEEKYQSQ